jgi:hypothetical protein
MLDGKGKGLSARPVARLGGSGRVTHYKRGVKIARPSLLHLRSRMALGREAQRTMQKQQGRVEAPGRFELPTYGLGNRCSIHLSYGAVKGCGN